MVAYLIGIPFYLYIELHRIIKLYWKVASQDANNSILLNVGILSLEIFSLVSFCLDDGF